MSKILASVLLILATSSSANAEPLRVKFINQTGEEHKGCVLMVWDKAGNRHMDGVRPVGGNDTVIFSMPSCEEYTYWQFIASVKYSDNPDNFDTVLVDTGKREVTKCEYSITGTKG